MRETLAFLRYGNPEIILPPLFLSAHQTQPRCFPMQSVCLKTSNIYKTQPHFITEVKWNSSAFHHWAVFTWQFVDVSRCICPNAANPPPPCPPLSSLHPHLLPPVAIRASWLRFWLSRWVLFWSGSSPHLSGHQGGGWSACVQWSSGRLPSLAPGSESCASFCSPERGSSPRSSPESESSVLQPAGQRECTSVDAVAKRTLKSENLDDCNTRSAISHRSLGG